MKLPFILLCVLGLSTATAQTGPRLFFKTAQVFDLECSRRTGAALEESQQRELHQRLPEFQKEWDERSRTLNPLSEAAAGLKFSRKEYSVALTVCPWTPMGDPVFIVSARPYLRSAQRPLAVPAGMPVFVSMVHHELLHELVGNIFEEEFGLRSKMLLKYKAENVNVLVHLHLLAIQKATYDALGDRGLLAATDSLYKDLIGGDYKRAWEIVLLEGTEAFTSELQEYNKPKP